MNENNSDVNKIQHRESTFISVIDLKENSKNIRQLNEESIQIKTSKVSRLYNVFIEWSKTCDINCYLKMLENMAFGAIL